MFNVIGEDAPNFRWAGLLAQPGKLDWRPDGSATLNWRGRNRRDDFRRLLLNNCLPHVRPRC